MSLLPNGSDPKTLEDVLQQSAGSQTANLTDQYQQSRKRQVSQLAANGQLMGGTSAYPLTDLDTGYQKGLSGIQTNLAGEESSVPSEDWLNQNQFQNQLGLANDIASRLGPSLLEQIFQGIGTAGKIGSTVAGFASL